MSKIRKEDEHGLTAIDRENLQLLSEGLSIREVAARRFVAYCTVKHQTSQIYEILGAKNNVHAVAIALRKGIIT